LGERCSRSRRGFEDEQTVLSFWEAEFVGTAEHSLAFHSAQFTNLNLEIAGQNRAGQRERDTVTDLEIFCTADDLAGCTGTVVDFANAEPIGIGVRNTFLNFGHHHLWDGNAECLDALDLDSGQSQEFNERIDALG
jgi:hypothetical protein